MTVWPDFVGLISPCMVLNATVALRRQLQVLWFQYEIAFGAYCFVWWEKLIVHAILLSIIFLVCYGLSMQVWAIRTFCDMAWRWLHS